MVDNPAQEDFRQRLTEYLEAVMDVPSVEVYTLQPLAGGTSRDNWLVGVEVDGEKQQLVLRRDLATTMDEQALPRDQEFLVMQAAYESSVRVPKPRWYCLEALILDTPFLLMDYVEGESIGKKIVQDSEFAEARLHLPEQMGQQLACIHAVNLEKFDLKFLSSPRPGFSPAQERLLQIRALILKLGLHNPVFEFGLRWAEQHTPACDKPVLLQGDFRFGNLLVGVKGLNGIVDWEFSRIGDPLEDVAWPCIRDWRYGNGEQKLGGIADREPFIKAYETAKGCVVDRKAVDFWEIVGNLRWAVTCLSQANRHLSGGDQSIELASLGRRSAEMQYEMLRLIGEMGL
ncbi:MAG: phosphotransferase family protein [Anaerolineae bacterium]|nr:phosphotransferase family protein [Anaerolineae bacterium]